MHPLAPQWSTSYQAVSLICLKITTFTRHSRLDTEFVIMNAGEPEANVASKTLDPVVPPGENVMHMEYKGRIVPGIVSRAKSGGKAQKGAVSETLKKRRVLATHANPPSFVNPS